ILISDGMANMPRSDSVGLGSTWTGLCPINSSNATSLTGIRFTHFVAVATGNDVNNPLPRNTDWSGSTGLTKYVPPCQGYLNNYGGKTGSQFMAAMVDRFPGYNSSSTRAPITSIQEEITPTHLRMEDVINTN